MIPVVGFVERRGRSIRSSGAATSCFVPVGTVRTSSTVMSFAGVQGAVRSICDELTDTLVCFALALDVPTKAALPFTSPEAEPLLAEFGNVFLEDLPGELPPMYHIEHAMDLVLGALLSNLPHYCMEPTGYEEL